nr:MAG TPA: hypothetical protein [Caudoviricetes sp.]
MTNIYISVHPVSHRLEWRGWGGGLLACPTSHRLQMPSLYND